MADLVDQLIQQNYLKTPRIVEAFRKIKRADFVPEEVKVAQGEDFINSYNAPLQIGHGQTISQPLTVAFVLELLQPQEGDKILDIGSGSGWQAALLSQIVGEKGLVYAIEIIPELKEFGEKNAEKYRLSNIEFICGDGASGFSSQAPFDKIVVAAAVQTKGDVSGVGAVPSPWKKQLKKGGRLVVPIEHSIWLLVKKSEEDFIQKEFPGFSFVPLIKTNEKNS